MNTEVVRSTPAFRLSRTPRKIALLAHVLASVGWFGMAIMVAAAGVTAAATGDATLPSFLYRVMADAVWLTVPMGVLALATGVLLGVGTKWGSSPTGGWCPRSASMPLSW